MEINMFGYQMRLEYVVLIVILVAFINAISFFSCAGGIKEGFQAIDNLGANLSYMMGKDINGGVYDLQFSNSDSSTLKNDIENVNPPYEPEHMDAKKEVKEINIYKDLETNASTSNEVKSNMSDNEMSFFENTKFSPECCPSNYATSTGCACMTPEQMKFLGQRGGNRTLDIEPSA